jgi:hypothetical protein
MRGSDLQGQWIILDLGWFHVTLVDDSVTLLLSPDPLRSAVFTLPYFIMPPFMAVADVGYSRYIRDICSFVEEYIFK